MPALINGVNYSWGNLSIVLFGNVIIGLTKISYKRKQEKTNNYGAGFEPISRGYGRIEYEGSIEIYVDELKRLISAAPNKDILQIAPSDVQVVFAGQRVLPNKDTLNYVEFLEDPLDANEGDTKLLVTIPVILAGLKRDGI